MHFRIPRKVLNSREGTRFLQGDKLFCGVAPSLAASRGRSAQRWRNGPLWLIGEGPIKPEETCVSFDEAKTVFNDPRSITIADEQHSEEEERYVDIGVSSPAA